MSRHTILKQPNKCVIVGYDRPLNIFFLQVWDGVDLVHDIDCLEELSDIGEFAPIPDGLIEQLIKEASGEVETSTVKTWF